jgi:hypothetical protein
MPSRGGGRDGGVLSVSILSRAVVVKEVHASGLGGGPSMQLLQQRG